MRTLTTDELKVLAHRVVDPEGWWVNAQTAYTVAIKDTVGAAMAREIGVAQSACETLGLPFDIVTAVKNADAKSALAAEAAAERALAGKIASARLEYEAAVAAGNYKNRAQRDEDEKVARGIKEAAAAATEHAALEAAATAQAEAETARINAAVQAALVAAGVIEAP